MRRFSDLVRLIGLTSLSGVNGDTITEQPPRDVLAEKKSVRLSEYYQALANALRPEVMFVIWSSEYNDEPLLEYEGVRYQIIRTFVPPNDRVVELVCTVQDLVKTNLARMREEIEVWYLAPSLNDLSETIQEEALFLTLPAEVVPVSGGVTGQAADTKIVNVSHKLIVKYREGLTPDMFIRFGEKRMEIRYILNPFSRNETLEIYVEELIE
ncbi:head-tail adaptor protein [Cohnella cholangitidis]|uniref:Head-tail adaptor protein n=1 Tax=Cohnella cholangitidis TaxID=2598458 RepID=A0A7G5C3F4_9BACL|nr:head-tail adaptor protein [Cohnella cholangitidis]QMV43738.1 head-tail adaptor protein [Cohnella cholangitidis]